MLTLGSHRGAFQDHNLQRAINCSHARVDLAEIPFLRLRDALSAHLQTGGQLHFGDALQRAALAVQPIQVSLDPHHQAIVVSRETVRMPQTQFALYACLAYRHRQGEPEFVPSNFEHAGLFLDFVRNTFGQLHAAYERAEQSVQSCIKSHDPKAMKQYFPSIISRLDARLEDTLGLLLAQRCSIKSRGKRGQMRYALPADLTVH
jgi:hypothetical protein